MLAKLTRKVGTEVWVNPKWVAWVEPDGFGDGHASEIRLATGETLTVQESVEVVAKRLLARGEHE